MGEPEVKPPRALKLSSPPVLDLLLLCERVPHAFLLFISPDVIEFCQQEYKDRY